MPEPLLGGCLCGAIRYEITAEPLLVTLCHCSACRRASGSPAVGWATVSPEDFTVTEGEPALNPSSPGVERGFCSRCGTQLTYTADFLSGLVDVTTGSLDDPNRLPPQMHIWTTHRLAWMEPALPDLPQHPGFPSQS